MKYLTIVFLMSSFSCFAQTDENKGTIKVKKMPVERKAIDTMVATSTAWISYPRYFPQSSYGQEYDRRPEYIGGDSASNYFINHNRQIPDCYKCKGSTVVSIMTFTIDEDGSLSDIVLKTGAQDCKKCDEEAIRIMKLMPKWKPAVLKGQKIKIKWD
ncbi:MAG: energy transducer TonB, partial [Bacteroidia bacterium]